jgi:hypothetical protein
MLVMSDQIKHDVERLVESIISRGQSLDAVAQRLRTPQILSAFNKWDHKSWCRSVAGDALVRLRLFTEQNFNFIETMGVISVARYIFELSTWLKLFELDPRYGLVYYHQLLDTQEHHFRAVRSQLRREVTMLKSFDEREKESQGEVLENSKSVSSATLLSSLKTISDGIDTEASRGFSIYAKDAQVNGYGFQAFLVETKAIPQVEQALSDIADEGRKFDAIVPQDVKDLIPRRWQWRQMAEKVGLVDEYDYIYSFTSKLLHATPASITTDQKNLELPEIRVFLKYIEVKMADIESLAAECC